MTKKSEEIAAIFIRERIRFGEVSINTVVLNEKAQEYAEAEKDQDPFAIDAKKLETVVKCESDEGELESGTSYRFYGHWHKHWKHGMQFHARTFTKVTPHDKIGVINYLMKAPGIGKKRAEKLWSVYQSDAVKKLRESPKECAACFGVKPTKSLYEKLDEAAAYLEQEREVEDATIECVSLLAGRGFPKRLPNTLIKKYGNAAAEKVRRNPYILMKEKGVGFQRADDMYLDLGGKPAALKRQALAIWHGMDSDSNGHTWFDTGFVERTLREKIAGADADPVKAVRLGIRAGLLAVYRDFEKRPWFTVRQRSEDEEDIAQCLAWLATRDTAWPSVLMSGLSDHQEKEVEKALKRPVGIFAGDPGTGKSFTAARIVSRIAELNGYEEIAVVAPTGKAAVRVTEAMNECGVNIRARTVHSLLGVRIGDGGWSFIHGADNPIEERYVIVDEGSMLDTPIMAALARALRRDAHLLLVGDLQQLPPVGHGAPLRDLLKAGVPIGNLTEIRRNAGAIVATCKAIREEKPPAIPDRLNLDQGENITVRECVEEQAAERIESLVKTIRDRKLCDAVWDLQVIVALNDKSLVARKALNTSLQAELNSKNRDKQMRFWKNDKIVCLRNQALPLDLELMESVDDDLEGMVGETASGDAAAYIANGEIGRVVATAPNKVTMEFFSPTRIVYCPKSPEAFDLEGFDLGYAISCHKSQGSQWKVAIVALDSSGGARRVCDRSWIYTAISRAEQVCFLVGKRHTLTQMCRTQKIDRRKTFLVARYLDEIEKRVHELAEVKR